MTSPREILNRLKWKEGEDISEATVHYIHRGAPGDTKAISGAEIKKLESYYMELDAGTCIPYHRIYKITYRGATIFEKHKK
jgi:uncharacterized protein (UPF0248 family)